MRIYVDADSSPVKNEVVRVAGRYGLKAVLVANSPLQVPKSCAVETILVRGGMDAADDWIAEAVGNDDIVVTGDIPLISRCIEKGARVLDPKGRVYTEESIGEALAHRDLMTYLRDLGNVTGGPPPYGKKDRSRFLQHLDNLIQALLKEKRSQNE
jgi:uncharacterized protein